MLLWMLHVWNCCYCQHGDNTSCGLITKFRLNVAKCSVFKSVSHIQNVKKLDACSRKGYFVWYNNESPSNLVYYPKNNFVMKRRVIKFTYKLRWVESLSIEVVFLLIIMKLEHLQLSLKTKILSKLLNLLVVTLWGKVTLCLI